MWVRRGLRGIGYYGDLGHCGRLDWRSLSSVSRRIAGGFFSSCPVCIPICVTLDCWTNILLWDGLEMGSLRIVVSVMIIVMIQDARDAASFT